MLATSIKLSLNKNLFFKDPEETGLGRNFLCKSIRLIDELGFEAFFLKKLTTIKNFTGASIYQFFDNTYRILYYPISWHKLMLDFKIKNLLSISDLQISKQNYTQLKEYLKHILFSAVNNG